VPRKDGHSEKTRSRRRRKRIGNAKRALAARLGLNGDDGAGLRSGGVIDVAQRGELAFWSQSP
jgi:hypothetical protein